MRSSQWIRQTFLDFFEKHAHTIVPSSSLVPHNDSTLLFTNAGMVQFKDVFLGLDHRSYVRATSSQRCVRAGGKHNDLDNVGYTARHHTFFEMLGNFSFGDYFKREAIQFAWTLLTEGFGLPAEKLWVTVFTDDQEAADIWINAIGVDPNRLSRCGEKDNFWSMGDTGPCGPCTEIFYDHGADVAGGPPGSSDADGDRYIEIWNLVFMQYDRDISGTLKPLPKPSVDTGMGLERLTAVLQGVHNNFETDLFTPIIAAAQKMSPLQNPALTSLRVIADHIRATAFLIMDSVLPSNEGRGYVLRRIMRRALRHGYQLNIPTPFFYQLVPTLVSIMGDAYPDLARAEKHIMDVIRQEEILFEGTLSQGMRLFENAIADIKDKKIPGAVAFRLYDTYGFPLDLTQDLAREGGLEVDLPGFDIAMNEQRTRSKAASSFKVQYASAYQIEGESIFHGYDTLLQTATVQTLMHDNNLVETLSVGQTGIVVVDHTPFYAEGGGQTGDSGWLYCALNNVDAPDTENCSLLFEVHDTQKQGQVYLHHGVLVKGTLTIGVTLTAAVQSDRRTAIERNHSATHLLDAGLIQILGDHVQQKGSLVLPDRLRFDFTHATAITLDQLYAVENWVNERIRENISAEIHHTTMDKAREMGAIALFGEKYGDLVRVLTFGDASKELCGGTHVKRTGDIGFFKIVGESGIAAGIRRIEAFTGNAAVEWAQQSDALITDAASRFKTSRDQVLLKIDQLIEQKRILEKQYAALEQQSLSALAQTIIEKAEVKDEVHIVVSAVSVSTKSLRMLANTVMQTLGPCGAILLANVDAEQISLISVVGKKLTAKISAQEWMTPLLVLIDGKGGGKSDSAQGSGSKIGAQDAVLKNARAWINERIG